MKLSVLLYLLMVGLIWADEFPKLPNTESTTDADPPSAEESAKAFSLPEGTKVKVLQRGSHMVMQKRLETTTITLPVGSQRTQNWDFTIHSKTAFTIFKNGRTQY